MLKRLAEKNVEGIKIKVLFQLHINIFWPFFTVANIFFKNKHLMCPTTSLPSFFKIVTCVKLHISLEMKIHKKIFQTSSRVFFHRYNRLKNRIINPLKRSFPKAVYWKNFFFSKRFRCGKNDKKSYFLQNYNNNIIILLKNYP